MDNMDLFVAEKSNDAYFMARLTLITGECCVSLQ